MPAEPLTREHVAHLTRDLSFSEKVALSAAVDLADANGALRSTSIAEIGAHAAINPKLVRRALREAASAGLLTIEPRAHLERRSPRLSVSITFVSAEVRAALWLHTKADPPICQWSNHQRSTCTLIYRPLSGSVFASRPARSPGQIG